MAQFRGSKIGAGSPTRGRQGPNPRMSPEVALSWLKAAGISEAALQDFANGVSTVLSAIMKGLQDAVDAAQQAHQRSAELALDYQRARIRAWKPADIQRIRQLNAAVAPNAKLTADEEDWLARVVACKPLGRPGGNTGPPTLLEKIKMLWAWSQMPSGTPNERREKARRSPFFSRILAEAYASEHARWKALGKEALPLHMSTHEAAEKAVADVFGISIAKLRVLKRGVVEDVIDLDCLAGHRAWIEAGVE